MHVCVSMLRQRAHNACTISSLSPWLPAAAAEAGAEETVDEGVGRTVEGRQAVDEYRDGNLPLAVR